MTVPDQTQSSLWRVEEPKTLKHSLPIPIGEYCRRDNRVYAACPLQNNWETCILHGQCLLLACTTEPERLEQSLSLEPHARAAGDATYRLEPPR